MALRVVASVFLVALFFWGSHRFDNVLECAVGRAPCQKSGANLIKAKARRLQLKASGSSRAEAPHFITNKTFANVFSCCQKCDGKPFCSPSSGMCYEQKHKSYYKVCQQDTVAPTCCSNCEAEHFCSPISGSCYNEKKKEYYLSCILKPSPSITPVPAPVPLPSTTTSTTTTCATIPWWFQAAAFQTIAITEMPLEDLYTFLDTLEKYGTRVLGLNVGYFNGPLAMWGGLAMNDPFEVNTAFGSAAEFDKFIAKAHEKGMRVISWMNPSYWWTGSKYFKQAERDMKAIKDNGLDWKTALPADSPARWFKWSTEWSDKQKPADDNSYASYPGEVLNWVWDADVGHSYLAHWADQPMADFNSPEFQETWKLILNYWINERHLDGFVYDAPDRYLGVETGSLQQRFYDEQGIAPGQFKRVITEPARALRCQFAQFAEGYGDQHEMVVFGLDAVLQSEWDKRFQAWGDIVEGIKAKDTSRIDEAFADYDKLLRTNKASHYHGILWQRHHNFPFGEQDPARNALARAIAAIGGYLTAVEDPGRAWEWYETDSNQRWWEADPYTGTERVLQDVATAMEVCEAFAHGSEREPLAAYSDCCGKCSGKHFCSPNSGNCYDWKRHDYYLTCSEKSAPPATSLVQLGRSPKFYAVLRYIEDGHAGFAVFNLENFEATATIDVPAWLRGQVASECGASTDEQSSPLLDKYVIKIPAYGLKIMSVTMQLDSAHMNATL